MSDPSGAFLPADGRRAAAAAGRPAISPYAYERGDAMEMAASGALGAYLRCATAPSGPTTCAEIARAKRCQEGQMFGSILMRRGGTVP
jgi:hypothetical protein